MFMRLPNPMWLAACEAARFPSVMSRRVIERSLPLLKRMSLLFHKLTTVMKGPCMLAINGYQTVSYLLVLEQHFSIDVGTA